MTTEKSAREAWEEGYSWGYTDGARVGFYDATQNPYVDKPLDLDPLPWVGMTDRGPFRSSTHSTLREESDTFDPRPGYSQNREDYE